MFRKIFRITYNRVFTNRTSLLNQHIKAVHEEKKFSCSYCERKFARKSDVQKHERIIHKNIL